MDVGDEGLGLKPMQKARLKKEIDNAILRAPGGKAPQVPEIGARLSGAGADHGDLSRSCRGYEATSPPSVLARMEEACSSCRQLTGSSFTVVVPQFRAAFIARCRWVPTVTGRVWKFSKEHPRTPNCLREFYHTSKQSKNPPPSHSLSLTRWLIQPAPYLLGGCSPAQQNT